MAINVTLTEQPLTDGTKVLKLSTPYSPALPAKARALGGRWHAETKSWRFDLRDVERVRDLCTDIFGIDPLAAPDEAPELVTVRVKLDAYTVNRDLWLFGREIADQPSRDGRPRLGQGVVILEGGFKGGGSMKNPALNPKDGTIVEVRDVPKELVAQEIKGRVAIVDAARASVEKRRAVLAEAEATLAAGPTEADRQMQILKTGGYGIPAVYMTPDEAAEVRMKQKADAVERARTELANAEKWLGQVTDAIVIVDAEPVERVDPAVQQAMALLRTMSLGEKRQIILGVLAGLQGKERADLRAEIMKYVEQGAI